MKKHGAFFVGGLATGLATGKNTDVGDPKPDEPFYWLLDEEDEDDWDDDEDLDDDLDDDEDDDDDDDDDLDDDEDDDWDDEDDDDDELN